MGRCVRNLYEQMRSLKTSGGVGFAKCHWAGAVLLAGGSGAGGTGEDLDQINIDQRPGKECILQKVLGRPSCNGFTPLITPASVA